MALFELSVAGYRSIRDIRRIELDRVNLVVGTNGSGKTNLYRSLELLQACAEGRLARSLLNEGGMPAALWRGARRKGPVRLVIGVDFKEFEYELQLGLPIPGETAFNLDPVVKQERIHVATAGRRICMLERDNASAWVRDEQGRKTEFAHFLSTSESILSELRDPARFPILSLLRGELFSWRFYHRFRTDELSPIRRPQPGVRTPVLSADGSDLAAALQTVREIGDGNRLNQAIADAFPGSSLAIQQTGLGFSLGLRMPEFVDPLWQQELSDGMLQYLCLVAALLSPRPASLIVLNEPETSLHEQMLPALASLIAYASEQSQLLVTTHSSQLCDLVEKLVRVNTLRLQKIKGESQLAGYNMLGAGNSEGEQG